MNINRRTVINWLLSCLIKRKGNDQYSHLNLNTMVRKTTAQLFSQEPLSHSKESGETQASKKITFYRESEQPLYWLLIKFVRYDRRPNFLAPKPRKAASLSQSLNMKKLGERRSLNHEMKLKQNKGFHPNSKNSNVKLQKPYETISFSQSYSLRRRESMQQDP